VLRGSLAPGWANNSASRVRGAPLDFEPHVAAPSARQVAEARVWFLSCRQIRERDAQNRRNASPCDRHAQVCGAWPGRACSNSLESCRSCSCRGGYSPADYGLAGMAAAISGVLAIAGDTGVVASLVRQPEIDEEAEATGFWVALAGAWPRRRDRGLCTAPGAVRSPIPHVTGWNLGHTMAIRLV
jgi:hypothetical protein